MKRTYGRFFLSGFISGLMFTLLFSLGVTYAIATSNPLILILALAIPVLAFVLSKRRIAQEREQSSYFKVNQAYLVTVSGFCVGILLHFLLVLIFF